MTSLAGEGAFSTVLRTLENGRFVAHKRIRFVGGSNDVPSGVFREMMALKHLGGHPNIVHLLRVDPSDCGVVLVLEYVPMDAASLLQVQQPYLPQRAVKALLRMLLKGLAHMHGKRIMHRDIKPSNVLVGCDGVLKIADFGLARVFYPEDGMRTYSHQVYTRWYRPPEILYGATCYDGPSADMWAAGLVAAELFEGIPLLPGTNDIDQISRIFHALGSPNEESWPEFNALPDAGKISFAEIDISPEKGAGRLFFRIRDDPVSAHFVLRMIKLNPRARASASELLSDGYFHRGDPAASPEDIGNLVHLGLMKVKYTNHFETV